MEDVLVVVDGISAVSRGGDNTSTTTREQTLQDLHTDRALSDTGQQSRLFGVSDTGRGDLRQDVEVCSSAPNSTADGTHTNVGELLRVGPARSGLSLQVQERQVRLLDLCPVLNVGPEELRRRSPLLGALGPRHSGVLEGDGRRVLGGRVAERLDDFAVHRLDGGLLSGGDGGLRVDELPELVWSVSMCGKSESGLTNVGLDLVQVDRGLDLSA